MKRVGNIPVLVAALGMIGLAAFQQETTDATASYSPSTSVPSTSPAPVPSTSPASTPSTSVSNPAASAPAGAGLVLGPDGLGSLELGMTIEQAEATGMVEPFRNEPNSDRCFWRSRISAAPADKGIVFHSSTYGVATIDAYAGVQTPEGIMIGSPLAAVDQAYPGWSRADELGRGTAPVTDRSQEVYRIAFADGKVTQLTLQYARQDCYE